ncbi:MAG: S-layer homology domain-containing protein [Oscillospiraceae bacterium]|nr:S-layer homology domain-containing protein [Oscillospiraceae bacterium]
MKKNAICQIAGTCAIALLASLLSVTQAAALTAPYALRPWDGTTIDVSWYNTEDTTFEIDTPEKLMGLAAIVNGIYNTEIETVIGDASYIVDLESWAESGSNNKSTDDYHYGADDFNGKTVLLTAELDMGGVCGDYNTWSGPNFMPIGGQYLMEDENTATKIGASFNGTFDGNGHTIYNIYCDRHCTLNYGDGASVGVIGRLGCHDDDPVSLRADNPTVRNVAVTGFINANRSVGGIVGKIGKTNQGGIIENCANFARISGSDAKGTGGIVGAGWNGGYVKDCYNTGDVSGGWPAGGISGTNEILLKNCYSTGNITAGMGDSFAMGISTMNGLASQLVNCYYLAGSAPGGGYYIKGTVDDSGVRSEAAMKDPAFAALLGDAYVADTAGINNGYPVLRWQAESTATNGRAPAKSTGFQDVPEDAAYAGAVTYVVDAGLFYGTGSGTFSPQADMTRGMLATVLYRLQGAPPVTGSSGFLDGKDGSWYADAITWAAAYNMISGVSPTAFRPDDPVTWEQAITVLYRYETVFSQGDAGGDNVEALIWAQSSGVISDSFAASLQATVTRAQFAQMMSDYLV